MENKVIMSEENRVFVHLSPQIRQSNEKNHKTSLQSMMIDGRVHHHATPAYISYGAIPNFVEYDREPRISYFVFAWMHTLAMTMIFMVLLTILLIYSARYRYSLTVTS